MVTGWSTPCCSIDAASSCSSPRSRRTLAGSRSIRSRLISRTSIVVAVVSVILGDLPSAGHTARVLAGLLPAGFREVGSCGVGGARALGRLVTGSLLCLDADHAAGGLGGGDADSDVEPGALAVIAEDRQVQLIASQVHLPQLLAGVVRPPDQDGLVAWPKQAGPGLGQWACRDHGGHTGVSDKRRDSFLRLAEAELDDIAEHGDGVVLVAAGGVV